MNPLKAIITRWVKEAWNSGNLAVSDEIFAPGYVVHDPASPPSPLRGPEAIKQLLARYRSGVPDVQIVIDEMVAEGNTVVWRWSLTGTHLGDLMGIAPTKRSVAVTGMVMSRFENGKWAEDHVNWNTLGMLQQIGVVPTP
jgi:steroid delta-isomerase-like uncharacterized protein